ncbi:site-2 protease family protein [Planctomicrobium piriforme]|uniref:Zn-dependent protease (Includes SpoIVFB) n=1 Tax=Planctomicrobium piriforme TaxID=1576369 RepID=A0A1I3GKD9_9PLAN|nr:site-2 protease family protein [Planctomicrobium piriforme]SFI23913.1 Zn-dependent protease (includes SpoIVFB) [Planctomicrobium piriforme]
MFGTVEPTPFDLEFSLWRIPVRVSVWFWVGGTLLGYGALKAGVQYLAAWLLVLFVSILVHELGHALTARRFGYSPRILLYHFGGLAMYDTYGWRESTTRSVLISLAGPVAGFGLYGVTQLLLLFGVPLLPKEMPDNVWMLLAFTFGQLLYINLWWGLVNLLPVLPLDGGRISQALCSTRNPAWGLLTAARIGAVVAGGAAVYFYMEHDTYAAVLFAMLCATNVSILQERGRW